MEGWWALTMGIDYQNQHCTTQQLAGYGRMIMHRAQEGMYTEKWKDCSMG